MALLLAVITAVLGRLVTDEVNAWLPALAQRLVRYNTAKLPPDLTPRLLEEWQADLAHIPGNISKLLFALDLARGRRRIIHEWYTPEVPFRPVAQFAIRLLDLSLAGLGLLTVLPLYLLAALAIKLESPGSIFVQIPRVSIRGHSFDLLKFRTVALSAKDSQVTRIGKILRVTALDELPQLWNIWKGDMSFIGPRPLSTEMLEYFDAQQLHKWLSVRPGLVSFAAMNGQRVLNFDNWIRLNLEYVDKPSVWLYLKTLLKPFLIGIGLRRDRRSS